MIIPRAIPRVNRLLNRLRSLRDNRLCSRHNNPIVDPLFNRRAVRQLNLLLNLLLNPLRNRRTSPRLNRARSHQDNHR